MYRGSTGINIDPIIDHINLDLGVYRDVTDITTKEIDQLVGIISTGKQMAWNMASS